MSELLTCRGLRKTYNSGSRRVEVLRGLDLSVERGEMACIVGESGVGKSTLLHLLGALDQIDSGSYLFNGKEVAAMDGSQRAAFRNRSIGFVFQFHHLLPELTVIENALLPGLIGGAPRREAASRARELLGSLGLTEMLHQYPSQLSGGEQQRVAAARALMTARDLILADEPTGNLDPATADRVFDAFRKVQTERELAAIVVTHNEKLAKRCDRVLELRDGVLARVHAPETVLATARHEA
jgi:lipoprotein-releasing system ATP-binding protein